MAKAGVIAFVQALAQETKGRGVTVNAVLPSTMDTPGNRASMPDVDPHTWTPVTAVADAIAYLAGESAASRQRHARRDLMPGPKTSSPAHVPPPGRATHRRAAG